MILPPHHLHLCCLSFSRGTRATWKRAIECWVAWQNGCLMMNGGDSLNALILNVVSMPTGFRCCCGAEETVGPQATQACILWTLWISLGGEGMGRKVSVLFLLTGEECDFWGELLLLLFYFISAFQWFEINCGFGGSLLSLTRRLYFKSPCWNTTFNLHEREGEFFKVPF